jgi:hypothetical protein
MEEGPKKEHILIQKIQKLCKSTEVTEVHQQFGFNESNPEIVQLILLRFHKIQVEWLSNLQAGKTISKAI